MAAEARAQAGDQNLPPGPIELLWRALNSLPVAIFVMLALALLSAIGTLIPQEHLQPQPPGMTFEQFLVQRYGEQKYRVLHGLGFDHIYFTWYFGVLLIWLAVSAVVCNIVRYRTTLKLWSSPPVRRGVRFYSADRRSLHFAAADGVQGALTAPALSKASAQQVAEAIREDLNLQGFRVRTECDGDTHMLYADRGFTKKWALVLLHFAVLVLLFGGMYGKAVGVEGSIRLADGEQQTLTVNAAAGKYNWLQPVLKLLPEQSYDLHQHGFRIDWGRKLVLESGILANIPQQFHEFFYYYVHDYVSVLEVTHKNRNVKREVIVNHPLVIEKLVLYQSGYDQRGWLSISSPEGETREVRLPDPVFGEDTWYALTADDIVIRDPRSGRWFVPEDQGTSVLMRFVPQGAPISNFSFKVLENVKAGDLFRHGEKTGEIEPMAIFSLGDSRSGVEFGSVLINAEQGFEPVIGSQTLRVRLAPRVDNFSIFTYKRDPGSPVLFLGWLLLLFGIAATLYVPFRQVWVRAEPGSVHVLPLGPGSGPKGQLAQRLAVIFGVKEDNSYPVTG